MHKDVFFDLSSDFLAAGPTGGRKWTAVNRALTDRLGWPADLVVNRDDLFEETGDGSTLRCADGQPLRVKWEIVSRDGIDYWVGRELTANRLRDVHHRVKNHMQMVLSLLSVQASASESSEVKQNLDIAYARVRALTKLYEPVYASPDFQLIEFGAYLEALAADQLPPSAFADVTDVVLDVREAVPLALIAAEALRAPLDRLEFGYLAPDRVELCFWGHFPSAPGGPDLGLIGVLGLQLGAELVCEDDRLSVTFAISQV